MRERLENLRSVSQRDEELEKAYRKCFNKAVHRFGNATDLDEKMKLYIDGLSKIIRTIAARNRESVPRRERTFEDLVHFASSEDEAVRA